MVHIKKKKKILKKKFSCIKCGLVLKAGASGRWVRSAVDGGEGCGGWCEAHVLKELQMGGREEAPCSASAGSLERFEQQVRADLERPNVRGNDASGKH